MFNPSRDQSRRFFCDAWRKHRAHEVLSGLEAQAVDHILRHPEYHGLLAKPETALEREWRPEDGETNPFLHLAMHLAITEQLAIDQPTGIRARFERLVRRLGDDHAAAHETMDCLAEMIWQAQRYGSAPDAEAYLHCLERRAKWRNA